MPELAADPNVQPAAAPQGDETWFTEQGAPAGETPQTPPAPPEYFLKAETGTVYKTPEEAARGVAEKDRLILQYRQQNEQMQRLLAASGVHVGGQAPQAQPQTLLDVLNAVVDNPNADPRMLDAAVDQMVQQRMQQQMQQQFAPLMPLVEYASLNRATEVAAQKYDPNIRSFVNSPQYQKVMEQWPTLRNAIEVSKYNPGFAQSFPEMLAIAYMLAGQGAAPPNAPVPQRPAPASTTPPQTLRAGVPQAPPAAPAPPNALQDPFLAAWGQVPDIPFTQVDWSKY